MPVRNGLPRAAASHVPGGSGTSTSGKFPPCRRFTAAPETGRRIRPTTTHRRIYRTRSSCRPSNRESHWAGWIASRDPPGEPQPVAADRPERFTLPGRDVDVSHDEKVAVEAALVPAPLARPVGRSISGTRRSASPSQVDRYDSEVEVVPGEKKQDTGRATKCNSTRTGLSPSSCETGRPRPRAP